MDMTESGEDRVKNISHLKTFSAMTLNQCCSFPGGWILLVHLSFGSGPYY